MPPNSHPDTEADAERIRDTAAVQSDAFENLTVLGVCGSIGSGKSFASRLLTSKLNQDRDTKIHASNHEEEDEDDEDDSNRKRVRVVVPHAYHIDTDSLAHGVYAPGNPALLDIQEEFGSQVVSEEGVIDRKALGGIVFTDPNQMKVSTCCFNTLVARERVTSSQFHYLLMYIVGLGMSHFTFLYFWDCLITRTGTEIGTIGMATCQDSLDGTSP